MNKKLEKIWQTIAQIRGVSKVLQVKVTYSEPVLITWGNYSKKKKTEYILNLGIIQDTQCLMKNRSNSRFGMPINHYSDVIYLDKIIDAEIYVSERSKLSKEEFFQKEAKKVLKKIHTNLWDDIRQEYTDFIDKGEKMYPENNYTKAPYAIVNSGKAKLRSITSVFDNRVLEQIKQAIENKTNFYHSIPSSSFHGRGRDRSVSIKMCEDGQLRAWFSSEYPGCGNGDYYILINPTTALYYERD